MSALAYAGDDMTFLHTPVFLNEVKSFIPASLRLAVDCTVGGGGHARAILAAYPTVRLIGLDRDPEAIAAASTALSEFSERVHLVHTPFSAISKIVNQMGWGQPDFILADLGVSSHQLNESRRGFSFQFDGPLDMRMDPRDESAADLLKRIDQNDLADAIFLFGQERHSRRIARYIKASLPTTTTELATIIRNVVPRAKDNIDPATRTFQALRMLVNREQQELQEWLTSIPATLAPHGIVAAISFHSGEDRLVKEAFKNASRDCICPHNIPACICGGKQATLTVLTTKPIIASASEIANNVRARS
ncbi:MAG: 16S rRNA (cytosine(1402)-N(4))-methyltransferase RsmH, partial [Deltaproteobacteria bacterium]|nr:16S rRNA (cytosine(1402)-N(4))-methyltransferase RsmH [Deltaproteobacteria bacterium]